jgi:uncharacterized UBP type Zn finger protein
MDVVLLDIGSDAGFAKGLAYVSLRFDLKISDTSKSFCFSRAKKLENVHLIAFNPAFQCSPTAANEYDRLRLTIQPPFDPVPPMPAINILPSIVPPELRNAWRRRTAVAQVQVEIDEEEVQKRKQHPVKKGKKTAGKKKPVKDAASASAAVGVAVESAAADVIDNLPVTDYIRLCNTDGVSCYANAALSAFLQCSLAVDLVARMNFSPIATAINTLVNAPRYPSPQVCHNSTRNLRTAVAGPNRRYVTSTRQEDAVEFLMAMVERLPNSVQKLFHFSLPEEWTCHSCRGVRSALGSLNPDTTLTLKPTARTTFQRCVSDSLRSTLPGVKCSMCRKIANQTSVKQLDMSDNKYLVTFFERYTRDPVTHAMVAFDDNINGLQQDSESFGGVQYRAIAAIEHCAGSGNVRRMGDYGHGHYLCWIRKFNKWWLLDDNKRPIPHTSLPVGLRRLRAIIFERSS